MTQPKDLNHLLSQEALSRNSSPLKSAFKYFRQPGMTFLGGGLPLPHYFPLLKVTAEIPSAPFANGIDGSQLKADDYTTIEINKFKEQDTEIEFARSLQYGYTEGHTELMDFVKKHTELIHNPPYEQWDIIASAGNTEAWDSTLRTFCGRGDTILAEEYAFSSALETASGLGVNTFPVPMDTEGVLPDKLSDILDNWVGPKPKLFYAIPTGQNPTGSCLSIERRKKVYELACKHDFIIIEDDPYYFLQMDTYTRDESARAGNQVHNHEEFIKSLVPTFLSLDTEGRVIRLDSVSKVMAPGLRFGWIIGQADLLERYTRLHEVSIQNPSGLSQSYVNGLWQKWGQDGYLDWLIKLRSEYTHKRDVAVDAIYKYCPLEISTFLPPVAGMFFTIYFDASKHPEFKTKYGEDPIKVEDAVYEQALKQGCLMIPGSWFKTEGNSVPPQLEHVPPPDLKNMIFFRGTYAAVPLDQLDIGIEKFGKAIRAEFNVN